MFVVVLVGMFSRVVDVMEEEETDKDDEVSMSVLVFVVVVVVVVEGLVPVG